MKKITEILNESIEFGNLKLTKKDRDRLLELDEEYGKLVLMYRNDFNTKDVKNMDSECKKFLKAREEGKKYFPKLKLVGKNGFETDGILKRLKNLLKEFMHFKCFISKYYIELIDAMIHTVEFSFDVKKYHVWYTQYRAQRPSYINYSKAIDMIKSNEYEEIDKDTRTIKGEDAAKRIQEYIDEKKYGWKVKMNKNMVPRMNVDIDRTMNVNPKAMFSEEDIEGLKAHEVDGHIGRRYYGLKTGLNLFLMGLQWRNTLDEGLAIYNSLHKCEHPKPNIKFNIALKCIIAYWLCEKDFCELFDFCKKFTGNMPDEALFACIARFKRELQDCSIIGGNGDDQSYFVGYQIVKKMDDDQRDDILKYNIGPDQIKDLPKIKEFLKVNKFPSLL